MVDVHAILGTRNFRVEALVAQMEVMEVMEEMEIMDTIQITTEIGVMVKGTSLRSSHSSNLCKSLLEVAAQVVILR